MHEYYDYLQRLTKKGIGAIRSAYAHDIFRQEFMSIYEKKTEQMQLLSKRLGNAGGKKVYGYLKADVKAIVDDIVDELAKEETVAACYQA